jgi:transposase, IS5 family
VPDEPSILRFRHLPEKDRLTGQLFAEFRQLLEVRLLPKSGTIVGATIIAAPLSTKKAAQERDPEMKQTKTGKQWHFGMKMHVGTDRRGLGEGVRTASAQRKTAARRPRFDWCDYRERCYGSMRTMVGLGMPAAPP